MNYRDEFISFCLEMNALTFGEFTLKSGRISPYFFNAGVFSTGHALARLGYFYAATIQEKFNDYDMLFGPAYKGIPLVCTAAISLAHDFNHNVPYAFNRKEAKDHGEGGNIVGSPLQGKVILIDDVITAGTAIRGSMPLLAEAGATLAGVVITLDRQERGQGSQSAIQEIEEKYKVPVISIITMQDIMNYLSKQEQSTDTLASMKAYREQYSC